MLEQILNLLTANWIWVIITLVWVMLLLNFATWILEEQLSTIWKKIKIPVWVRWATFDAVSSSLPEFLTAMIWLILLKEKWLEVGIWTISGSAIFNILIIPFFAILFYKANDIKISKWGIKRDSIFYVASIIVFLAWIFYNELFLMWIALLILYIFYIFVLYFESKKHKIKNAKEVELGYLEVKDKKVNYFNIVFSLFLVYVWVELSVRAAEFIWYSLGISTLVMSLFLLAAITSIPDTLLSVKASKKWDIDASLSNAVWSNIFDICIGLWVPIMIGIWIMWLNPKVEFSTQIPIFGFLIFSVIVYFIILNLKNLNKKHSFLLLALYLVFVGYLVYISV